MTTGDLKSFCREIPPNTLTVEKILAAIELTGRTELIIYTADDHQWPVVHDDELVAAGIAFTGFTTSPMRYIFFKRPTQ
jgi:hypothetical protein